PRSAGGGISPDRGGVLPVWEVPARHLTGMEAMVTNYPQRLTAHGHEGGGTAFVARTVTRLGQLLCGFRGHETMMHFEGKRLMMRCTSCGHDTPGGEIAGPDPRRRFDGDARRHQLNTSPRLVLRKTA